MTGPGGPRQRPEANSPRHEAPSGAPAVLNAAGSHLAEDVPCAFVDQTADAGQRSRPRRGPGRQDPETGASRVAHRIRIACRPVRSPSTTSPARGTQGAWPARGACARRVDASRATDYQTQARGLNARPVRSAQNGGLRGQGSGGPILSVSRHQRNDARKRHGGSPPCPVGRDAHGDDTQGRLHEGRATALPLPRPRPYRRGPRGRARTHRHRHDRTAGLIPCAHLFPP